MILNSFGEIFPLYDFLSKQFESFICSGPKRFDVIDGQWRYSHTGEALHDLLAREFSEQLGTEIDLSGLPHSFIQLDRDN